MSYDTYYVDSGKGVHKMGVGVVTSTDILLSSMQESTNEERARKLRYGLIDFTQTTELQVTTEVVRQLVEINRKMARLTPGAFVAVVAPSPFTYAMSRMWHTFSADLGWTAHVFHGRPEAIAWLRKQLGAEDELSPVLDEFPSLKAGD
jgi:hypothetical protein